MIGLNPLDHTPLPLIVTCPLAGVVVNAFVTANGVMAPTTPLTVASPLNVRALRVNLPEPPLLSARALAGSSAIVVAPTEPAPSSAPEITDTAPLTDPFTASVPLLTVVVPV